MNTLYQHTNPRARSRDTTFYLLSANSSQDSIHSHSDGTSNDIDQRSAPPSPLQEQPGECLDRTLDPMPSGSASVAKDDEPTEPPSTPLEGSSGAVLTARALECLGSKRTVSLRSLAKSHSTYDPETDSEISFNAYTPPDEEVFGWWPVSAQRTLTDLDPRTLCIALKALLRSHEEYDHRGISKSDHIWHG